MATFLRPVFAASRAQQSLADAPTGVPCSNDANIGERRLARKVNFAPGKIPSGDKKKNIYSVPALETAKHRAKFGWPPLSDVAAVTKARHETR